MVTHRNMTISIALIGFSNQSIDEGQLVGTLPSAFSPVLQTSSLAFGSYFELSYSVNLLNQQVNQSLRSFIRNNIVTKTVPSYLQQFVDVRDKASYSVIPANSVCDWVKINREQLGFLDSRYSILVANLTNVSPYDHYYESTFNTKDDNFKSSRYGQLGYSLYFPVVTWSISVGGANRFYFVDLSAGSRDATFDYTLRSIPHIPIQNFFSNIHAPTSHAISRFIADYVSEAVKHLITVDYSVFPPFAHNYFIDLILVDATGRILDSNYAEFLNETIVKKALAGFLPYANFTVRRHYVYLPADEGLSNHFAASLITTSSKVGFGTTGLTMRYYDGRNLATYLRQNLAQYVDLSIPQVVPVFCFAVSSAGRLVQTLETSVVSPLSIDPDGEPRDGTIIAFPDLALVSLSERQIFDWGVGFTHSVIQAVGHLLGLSETYGISFSDEEASVMSHLTYSYEFSQFDNDAIQRAHADYLLSLDAQQSDAVRGLAFPDFQDSSSQSLFQNATAEVKLALRFYDSGAFPSSILHLEGAFELLSMLFTLHSQWLRLKLDSIGPGSTLSTETVLANARHELVRASSARSNGDLDLSFSLLSDATVDAAVGAGAESMFNASRLSNVAVGILIGLIVGISLAVVALGRRSRARRDE